MSGLVVGVSDHNGWAICVCVAAHKGKPAIVDRRRVSLIDAGLPNLPFHHETFGMTLPQAEALIKEVQESALRCAERELNLLQSSVQGNLGTIVMRQPPLPKLPTVAESRASSHVNNRADPMIYLGALSTAASNLGIAMEWIPRGEERARAAKVLRITSDELDHWLAGLRAELGPPWQKDHRDAAAKAAAGLKLGKH
jgi:hypothetical protein